MMLSRIGECQEDQGSQPDYQFKIYLSECIHDLHNTNMTQVCLKGFIIIQKYVMIPNIQYFILTIV
jgi:hypothetical protein